MRSGLRSGLHRLARRARRLPLHTALAALAVLAAVYAVVAPFAAARYPAMTDLPFHAAQTSTLRHYFDPAFHQREQFEIHPIAVPYLSMYAIGAALMLVFPMLLSVKIAAAVMLGLLPAGLAVMFHGMKRSPLLGLAGLGMVWCNLTHWGFLNFVGALGLFAMVVGLALMVLDRPTRGRQIALGLALVALFFTHIFRFPFALAAVVGAAVVLYPATKRIRPIVLPMLPSLALFLVWLRVRPKTLATSFGPLGVHTERLREFEGYLFGAFNDPAEKRAVAIFGWVLAGVFAISLAAWILRVVEQRGRPLRWGPRFLQRAGAAFVPLACAAVFLGLFLTLPMEIGTWWYVYPREATAAAFLALGALPDLPRPLMVRAPLVAALAAAGIAMTQVVTKNYAVFDRATEDFYAVTRKIPTGPKLLYLIFDHGGSTRTNTPFIHLPAYVQAERGGWLSFHFAIFGASPIVYRDDPGAVVPPSVPRRWEWTPHLFDLKRQAPFFDWFLVRHNRSPDYLFKADPTIEPVDHVGTWWLYRRKGEAPAADAAPPR